MVQEAVREGPSQGKKEADLAAILLGFVTTRAIHVVIKLNIPQILKDGPKSLKELVQATGTHENSLRRLLRIVTAQGIFCETEAGIYAHNDYSLCLCPDYPGSMQALSYFSNEDWLNASLKELEYSVRTGESAFGRMYGMRYWDYFSSHPHESEIFNQAMLTFSSLEDELIITNYDFSPFQTLVDAGGGLGRFLLTLFKQHPSLHGTLFELPSTIEEAKTVVNQSDYADRCSLQGGDFFASIPEGADAYFFKGVLETWDDDHYLSILATCRRAMTSQSKLLIYPAFESSTGPIPDYFVMTDILALTVAGGSGYERTVGEVSTLLTRANFRLSRTIPIMSGLVLVEAVPV